MKKTPLSVKVEDGQLVIRIGVDTLAFAIANGDAFHDEEVRPFAIIDNTRFAKDIVIAMEAEEEDGSSPLTEFIEEAAQAAIDDGSEAVDYEQRVRFGKKGKGERF